VPRPAVSLQGLQKTYTRMGDSLDFSNAGGASGLRI
jgi:hypothetical protein